MNKAINKKINLLILLLSSISSLSCMEANQWIYEDDKNEHPLELSDKRHKFLITEQGSDYQFYHKVDNNFKRIIAMCKELKPLLEIAPYSHSTCLKNAFTPWPFNKKHLVV